MASLVVTNLNDGLTAKVKIDSPTPAVAYSVYLGAGYTPDYRVDWVFLRAVVGSEELVITPGPGIYFLYAHGENGERLAVNQLTLLPTDMDPGNPDPEYVWDAPIPAPPTAPPRATVDTCYDNPFARVWVENHISGGATVFWDLATSMVDDGPYEFSLKWSNFTQGPFYNVDVPVGIDTYFLDDPNRRLWGKDVDLYYKVRLETAGGLNAYESEPVRADGGMPRRDWLVARELTKNEYTHLLKGNGVYGRLFKRRKWGEGCEECRDHDTGLPSKAGCITCFETGIVGGYYIPVDLWVSSSTQKTQYRRDPERGMANDEQMRVRTVPYPMPESADIWVCQQDGKRYVVDDVTVVSKVRQKPVAVEMTLSLLATSGIAYRLDCLWAPERPIPEHSSIILVDAFGGNRLVDNNGNVLVV